MLEDIIKERIKKVSELRKRGIDPYPLTASRQYPIEFALQKFNAWLRAKKKVVVAGRIKAIRGHGALIFADLSDQNSQIQIILKADILGKEKIKFFEDFIDLGDFIEVAGKFYLTQKKEKSVLVSNFKILAKSLRPLPKSWYGLENIEERYRKRYLDLLVNQEVKQRFVVRSKIISLIRDYLNREGFLEVETPILQTLYGGANAKPFITHLDNLDLTLYLRIAPELYLKRLIVGGFEKIYELGRNFRNEGLDREHNPEFTMLELYEAYKTRDDLMKLISDLILYVVKNLKNEINVKFSSKKRWPVIDYEELLKKHTGLALTDDKTKWLTKSRDFQIAANQNDSVAKISELIFKKIRSQIIEPTFVINQPVEISPLAKTCPKDPLKAHRFQLIVGGWEIVNGFSELNDPLEQRKRFDWQQEMRVKGDLEAHPQDKDFLEALEYGLPPTAGLGVGIDRLVAVLTGAPSLNEVILFPFMKPLN
ncbi:MAG: lysine--tRNA ligase [Candidatus Pacebacteria bacterium]|nr:lysine--tRNA ligase [Candidatus Paceibacterota bacterium]